VARTTSKAARAGFSDPAVDRFQRLSRTDQDEITGVAPADLDTAKDTTGSARSGNPEWGQPSYLHGGDEKRQHDPDRPVKSAPTNTRVYFHCQTDLVETFRELYPRN